MVFEIGQIFEGEYPPEAAVFCNESGKAYIDEIESTPEGVRRFQIVAIPEPTAEELSKELRAKRDRLLRDTDKYLISDYPISPESLEHIKAYRVSLRELPEQSGFPTEVVFPVMPKIVDPTKSQESQIEEPKQDVGLAKVGM